MTDRPERFVCIHGHFYQPPRENPWLEAVEPQSSAAPFHDWNERVTHECYRPNSSARILDPDGFIVRIVNNYESMSFNFGPTLLAWLEQEAPEVYTAVLAADQGSLERFGGHGSAMAQVYNHVILPLAPRRDKETQVRWGIRDFERRFGRPPEGMWLPETAVDLESLDVLAAEGIRFTVLAPHQAHRVRPIGDSHWTEVGDRVDTRHPYRVNLPSGQLIDVFFYHGPTARAVAFERLLADGANFVDRLLDIHGGQRPGLAHIAVDGETFGHHHRYGDMALAYATDRIARGSTSRLTNYSEYLSLHPPTWECEIAEQTSWSCAHGVSRWRDDCGCNSGGQPDWRQRWRRPLRDTFDWLRGRVDAMYEQAVASLVADPWRARDAYIDVILDRSPASVNAFIRAQAGRELDGEERRRLLELLEMERNAQLMYTSCAWFFDEISGTETVQVLRYAARVLELAERYGDEPLVPRFLELLERAPSNLPMFGDGRRVYEQLVEPARVDLRRAVAHYAVAQLLSEDEQPDRRVYAYDIEPVDVERLAAGKARLALGNVVARSRLTGNEVRLCFAAVHLGEHNVAGGVRTYLSEESFQRIASDITAPFARADLVQTQRALDRHFANRSFSLASLFGDFRRHALTQILEPTLDEATAALLRIYRNNAPLLRYLSTHDLPPPRVLRTLEELAIELRVRAALADPEGPDVVALRGALTESSGHGAPLDAEVVYLWQGAVETLAQRLRGRSDEAEILDHLSALLSLADNAAIDIDPWRAQNACWALADSALPRHRVRVAAGDDAARRWISAFTRLCDQVHVRVGHEPGVDSP